MYMCMCMYVCMHVCIYIYISVYMNRTMCPRKGYGFFPPVILPLSPAASRPLIGVGDDHYPSFNKKSKPTIANHKVVPQFVSVQLVYKYYN